MEKEKQTASQGGIGFTGLLTIVFIVLKLTGVIEWSWVWVLSPIWIGAACSVVFIIVALVAYHRHVVKLADEAVREETDEKQ